MIELKNIHLQYGDKILYQDLNFIIHAQQKIGLIGNNGTGKSTLFQIIQKKIAEDKGECIVPDSCCIAELEQEVAALEISALDYVLSGDKERTQIIDALTKAELKKDGVKIAQLHMQLSDIDGYHTPIKAKQLLIGLGFSENSVENSVADFSGGWRMRLNLAKAMMSRANLLLLDEPTNHLDLEAIVYLESWLEKNESAVLIISHDRDFLDNSVDHIAHLFNHTIKTYSGNYSAFEQQQAEQILLQQKMVSKLERKRKHLQSFIDRFRAKATKAKQAQSRIKALEKLPTIQAYMANSPFNFTIPNPEKQPNPLLQIINADIGYPDKIVLSAINLSLAPQDRIGLLGLNGAGKSSLIKTLAGDLNLLCGEKILHSDTKIAYFAQQQVDHLNTEANLISHFFDLDPSSSEQDFRNHLGRFNFHGDQVFSPVGTLSGGEKSRLALSLLVWGKPNLLLLDEPTNHLDIEMKEALVQALQFYEGAVIIISHDRHLLTTSCDSFYLVEDQKANFFSYDLNDYLTWRKEQNNSVKGNKKSIPKKTKESTEKVKPNKNKAKIIEDQLEEVQQKLDQINDRLSSYFNQTLNEPEKLAELQAQQKSYQAKIVSLEEEWMMIHEL